MTTKVFIVIVSYNGMTWLRRCLKSCGSYDVIIVDNNSNDGTVPFIKSTFPEFVLLEQNENLGFGAANNIGISEALKNGADYVFLLNQDAYMEKYTLEKLIGIHSRNPDFGILSPIHLNGSGTQLDHNFSKYIKLNNALQSDFLTQSFSQQIYEVPFVNAAAWLLPRGTLEKVGGFDPIFYHYSEDVNYCQRVIFHNFKIGIVPETHILHDRELRSKLKITNTSENLAYFERSLKQSWANINIEIESQVRIKKQIIVKTILKSILKFRFYEVLGNLHKYRRLNHILPEILNSRKKNIKIGLHYLNE
ncbi:glycosyltransferase family 2 protein [Seonamhaeicola maritimus]|uniref:glycosyltransferase family 2 protein n=1 Tax=Seonamhaeicola maritimus TaxID=2591822 RepID=UPI002494319E|nr:glycosyltransferase family 2 protein [Seonamhaeicola maritimus]